ncbi:MAG TPA: thioredoxin family protein [Amycolatopsis sp.]|jgi:thiol-disulfide isomerase/thioredoxin|nr:thioredoxin family protein [Amycolatopsis sp.]
MTGLWVVLGVLALGAVAGVLLRARDGRVKATRRERAEGRALPGPVLAAIDRDSPVTLVQISTTFCAPCRHARVVLSSLAAETDGLRHVELDVSDRPEVAQALGVLRTPTTLAFSSAGDELFRISGVPKAGVVLDAVGPRLRGA